MDLDEAALEEMGFDVPAYEIGAAIERDARVGFARLAAEFFAAEADVESVSAGCHIDPGDALTGGSIRYFAELRFRDGVVYRDETIEPDTFAEDERYARCAAFEARIVDACRNTYGVIVPSEGLVTAFRDGRIESA